ncbi:MULTISPECIES: peptide deformylase [Thermus]|uniref:Peptide deformylase n=1 Tax=Thermus tengchongensis TaxID=1214928 RepID=A0A4Y9FB97_9DEIN|nr:MULTISPECIES: peptide deformylase [Thermus]TFU15774.1 peptide deformylase [Thermus tengchongensis]TFU25773.1 peptide deformylase [Thermus tengchongensis]
MIYPIRLYGDPVLRRRARPVQDFSGIKKLAEDMLETMFEARGVGLAAPQIGLSERLFVAVEYADEPEGEERPLRDLVRQVYVVANPVITHREGEVEGLEGCLSLPGLYAEEVPRAERIRVEYQDEEGRPRALELEGYMARVFQHEMDHLDGILFFERLPKAKREAFLEENRAELARMQKEARALLKELSRG